MRPRLRFLLPAAALGAAALWMFSSGSTPRPPLAAARTATPDPAAAPATSGSASGGAVHRLAADEQPPPAVATPSETGFLGRVVDVEGRPVEGARVLLRPGAAAATGRATAATRSGPDGRFALLGVEPVEPFRWSPPLALRVRTDDARAARRDRLYLGPGEVRDLGDVVVLPTAILAGRVERGDGTPVAGARVVSMDRYGEERSEDGEALSGPDGRFRFEGLLPGARLLFASAPGWTPAGAIPVALVAGEVRDGLLLRVRPARRVEVEVRDEAGRPVADAEVAAHVWSAVPSRYAAFARTDAAGRAVLLDAPPEPFYVAARHPRFGESQQEYVPEGRERVEVALWSRVVVSGEVVSAVDAAPVEGADVFLAEDAEQVCVLGTSLARTDGRGRFSVEVGACRIADAGAFGVVAAGFEPWFGDVPDDPEKGRPIWLSVRLRPTPPVRVRVFDPSGEPCPGVRLVVFAREWRKEADMAVLSRTEGRREFAVAERAVHAEALTDAEGRARVESLPPGRWVLCAYRTDLGCVEVPFEQREGAEVEVRLPRPGVLEVLVVDDSGAPLPGAVVEAAPPWSPRRVGRTDGKGLFVLDPAPAGRWRVEARRPGAGPSNWGIGQNPSLKGDPGWEAAQGYTESLAEGGRLRVVRRLATTRLATLLGEVRVDDRPVEGARVTLQRRDRSHRFLLEWRDTRTDGGGRFVFSGLPPASYEVLFRRSWKESLPQAKVRLAPGERRTVRFSFLSASLSGRLVASPGASPARVGLAVQIADPDSGWNDLSQTVTDEQGRFSFPHLVAGALRLRLVRPGWRLVGDPRLRLLPGEARDGFVVRAVEGGWIRFRATGAGGEPVYRFDVERRGADGWERVPLQWGSVDGQAFLDVRDAGAHLFLRIRRMDDDRGVPGPWIEREIDLPPSGLVDLRVTLPSR